MKALDNNTSATTATCRIYL